MDDGMDWSGLDYRMMPEEMQHALRIAVMRRAKRARARAIADFAKLLRAALTGAIRWPASGRRSAPGTKTPSRITSESFTSPSTRQ